MKKNQETNVIPLADLVPPLLDVSALSVRYGSGSLAVAGLSFDLPRGEILAILGPNGAGKTTTMRAISGLLPFHSGKIDTGEIRWNGRDISRLSPAARVWAGIAQVMEGRRIFGELSVAENLACGAFLRPAYGRGRIEMEESRESVLDFFPILRERLNAAAGYLSGGEQQMVAIGRALMAKPQLLLLDEPSLGIAPKVVAQIMEILRRINEQGVSIVLVEQNATIALDVCHRAVVLESGCVAMRGTAVDLRSDPRVRDIYLGLTASGSEQHMKRRSFRTAAVQGEVS